MDSNKKPNRATKILDPQKLESIVRHALVEDIGHGDITTQLTIPEDKEIDAVILTKQPCVVAGMAAAQCAFRLADETIKFKTLVKDGQVVEAGKNLVRLSGKARSVLTSERVALNLLCMLSGIATKTREYVKSIEPHKTIISDTRKTLPGLRELQKYAVRVGGGTSHRMSLDEMILIKDNHLKVTEGYSKLPSVPKGFKIEIETQNLEEFKHALKFKPDVIMLDNMGIEEMEEAVKIRDNTPFTSHHPKTKLEASGGIDFDNIKKVAATGVDIISIGALTHSIDSIDISLEIL